ncbi:MAG: substrate-binding domain-containing protein, partial [Caldilineaceae bacterium]|nr:substrate-binding domain-containing protein [Caldilineaceae bacterium]
MQALEIFPYLVEHSADAILMTDANLRVSFANYAFNQLVSRTVLGDSLRTLWWHEDWPLYDHVIESAQIGSMFSTTRVSGFVRIIDQFPGIKIVGRLAADWNRTRGYQAAEKLLRANPPGTLDVIWAASGEMALGALAALEAVNRQHEVKIFSNDVTPESTELIRQGRLQAETHHGFADWGWFGAKVAVMLALGQPVPEYFDIRPRTVYRSNVSHFYPDPQLEPIDWPAIARQQPLPTQITIGWIQAAATGVYETATRFLEKAAADARAHGIPAHVVTRLLAHPDDFAGAAAIIEQYIVERVDVIVLSTVKVAVIRRALRQAKVAGIPVIVVNQLEPIEGCDVACYIGFDNTVAGVISGYAVVNYLGGPGVLGRHLTAVVDLAVPLDLAWWEECYRSAATPQQHIGGRVAIIEGISGSWQGEHRLTQANGDPIDVDTTTFPVHNKRGEFLGLAAAFRDATKRKAIEQSLKAYSDHLEELVEQRTHDLQLAY